MQTCKWPSRCHCHSLSVASAKSRPVLSFRYRLTRVVPDKGLLNAHVQCACGGRYAFFICRATRRQILLPLHQISNDDKLKTNFREVPRYICFPTRAKLKFTDSSAVQLVCCKEFCYPTDQGWQVFASDW